MSWNNFSSLDLVASENFPFESTKLLIVKDKRESKLKLWPLEALHILYS